jgi:tRNA U55 pseudouridine synthase TruB
MKFLATAEDIHEADFAAGALLLVDKPRDWTSFDVVAKLRGILSPIAGVKRLKVGHSGTLDPMATGLLLICTGKWTKKLHELQGLDKGYAGQMRLGGVTASYDAETPVTDTKPIAGVTQKEIERAVSFDVTCSKGTYIRSLAHDIGQELSCGAYLTALRRTAIGPYTLTDAWSLPELVSTLQLRRQSMQTKIH